MARHKVAPYVAPQLAEAIGTYAQHSPTGNMQTDFT